VKTVEQITSGERLFGEPPMRDVERLRQGVSLGSRRSRRAWDIDSEDASIPREWIRSDGVK
jgi:hypothetical protein